MSVPVPPGAPEPAPRPAPSDADGPGSPDGGVDRSTRGQEAFDRAVRRERAAISLHERAAAMHDATAGRLDEAVLVAVDPPRAEALRERAATERRLAGVARARAAGVRARLAAEGVVDVG